MKKLPRRYFLVPQGPINDIVAEAFPDAETQREMPAVKNSRTFIIAFSWELSAEQLIQLKKFCLDQRIRFDAKVWVKCGDNPIHPAQESDWNPEVSRKKKRNRIIRKSIKTFVISHGKFPHQIP